MPQFIALKNDDVPIKYVKTFPIQRKYRGEYSITSI